jgi:hypothetical protein
VLQTTRTIPVVFVDVIDPVGGGFVESLARPGGNATGFAFAEYAVAGKWVQLLKEIAPDVKRVGVIRNPSVASGSGQFGAIQAVAPFLGMEASPIDAREAGEIERGIIALASLRPPDGWSGEESRALVWRFGRVAIIAFAITALTGILVVRLSGLFRRIGALYPHHCNSANANETLTLTR